MENNPKPSAHCISHYFCSFRILRMCNELVGMTRTLEQSVISKFPKGFDAIFLPATKKIPSLQDSSSSTFPSVSSVCVRGK